MARSKRRKPKFDGPTPSKRDKRRRPAHDAGPRRQYYDPGRKPQPRKPDGGA